MKKYISVILIPCILLKLYGCGFTTYSQITLKELENYDGLYIKITTDEEELNIRQETGKYITDFEIVDSTISFIKKERFRGDIIIPIDTTLIKYNEIRKIEVEKREDLSTSAYIWMIAGSIVLLGIIIWAGLEAGAFDIPLWE